MNRGPFKNIVDAVRDWVNLKEQQYKPGEIYEPVPDQIIDMLWNGDISFDELIPTSGADGLDPVDWDVNFEHFLQIFYPDLPNGLDPKYTFKFTNIGNEDLTIIAPDYSVYDDWVVDEQGKRPNQFFYKSVDGWVDWDQEGFVVAPGQTVETVGYMTYGDPGWMGCYVHVQGNSQLKISGYVGALGDLGMGGPNTAIVDFQFQQFFAYCDQLVDAGEVILNGKYKKDIVNSYVSPQPYRQCAYSCMFQECQNLKTGPNVPSKVSYNCCGGMFAGCSSLVNAPELPATKLADECYSYMFNHCTSLVTAPELPATVLAEHCYEGMFYECTSLETALVLPAETLVNGCYDELFTGCENLRYVKCLAKNNIGDPDYMDGWMYNTPNDPSCIFVKHPDVDWPRNIQGIPDQWTVVNDGEEP